MPESTESDALCRVLWLNVILRAVRDSEGVDLMDEDGRHESEIVRNGAEWLSTPSLDLQIVCDWAGTTCKRVLEKYGGG